MTRPKHAGSPGPIPSNLSEHLCIDFVNSRFTDHTGSGAVYDRLELEEWRRWFASRCGLVISEPLGADIKSQLVELRSLLRRLLESATDPDQEGLAELNRCLSKAYQSLELTKAGDGFELEPRWIHQNWSALIAAVVASYARLLVRRQVERVRVCANPDCSYMFFDDTRNASRRWCDVNFCGNLVKVRRHRKRARPFP